MRLFQLLLVGLICSGSAYGAERVTPDKLKDIDSDVEDLRSAVEELRRNFTERSGLIGVTEARQRYEDAVYQFLIGEYERASTSFFILVNSKALGNADLARDAEWYLGECLFKMGNYRTAAEGYRTILDVGQSHPYFTDAVRRSLEAFAILGDNAAFDSYYNSYITTGRVKTTDLINYTLAKSFRLRQEAAKAEQARQLAEQARQQSEQVRLQADPRASENARLKAEQARMAAEAARQQFQQARARTQPLFQAFAPTSEYYSRAHYFLGTDAVEDRRLSDAVMEFQRVAETAVSSEEQKEVQELAILALGSLYYEAGDFEKANQYYSKIGAQSPLYADQLFQSTWSFIKQQKYEDALQQVDVFLLHFPDHKYSPDMRLLQGKLQMKLEHYEEARATFETVSSQYAPIIKRLGQLEDGTLELRPYLAHALDEKAPDPGGMPNFALEMIYGDSQVERAVVAWQGVQAERTELAQAEQSLREIDLALSTNDNSLGSFVAARGQVQGFRGTILSLRAQLLEVEGAYLRPRIPSESRATFVQILDSRQQIVETMAASSGLNSDAASRLQIYDEQVREVQQRSNRLLQQVSEADALATTTLQYLDSGNSRLSPQDARLRRAELVNWQQNLADWRQKLEEAQGEAVKRKLMHTVDVPVATEDMEARKATRLQIENLRRQVSGYRRYATDADAATFFASVDRLWASVDQLEQGSDQLDTLVRSSESREMASVLAALENQRRRVTELRMDLQTRGITTETLAVAVLRGGMGNVREQFFDDVLTADKGVVDVYWVRKQQTTADMENLVKEQNRLLAELNQQYQIIQENLDR